MARLVMAVVISLLLPLSVFGQMAPGSWRLFPVFSDVSQIMDTPHFLYYVSEGCLYSFDKDNEETHIYNGAGDLSDNVVKKIYYNFAKNYLLVTYTNGNIDLLFADGQRVNLPEIKTAQIDYPKVINDVKFSGDEIYVATSFGLVVYSDTRHEVRQSGVYGINISAVAVTDGEIVVVTESGTFHAAPRDGRLNHFSVFGQIGEINGEITCLHTLESSQGRLLASVSGRLYLLHLSPDGVMDTRELTGYKDAGNLAPLATGVYFTQSGRLYLMDSTGNVDEVCVIPEPLRGSHLATLKGASSIWAASREGVGEYRITGAGLDVLHDRYIPADATSSGNICKIFPILSSPSEFYATNLGMNQNHPMGLNEGYGIKLRADRVGPEGVMPLRLFTKDGEEVENPTFVVGDPDDPSVIYVGSASGAGVIVTRDGREVGRFTPANSTMATARPSHAVIDGDGNLWVAVFTADTSLPAVAILPASRRLVDPAELTAADWVSPDLGSHLLSKDVRMVVCGQTDVALLFDSQYMGGLVGYGYGLRVEDTSDDTHIIHAPLRDSDGKSFTPAFFYCGEQDKRGCIWVGTSEGVIEIVRSTDLLNPSLEVRRLKVPRRDGSGLADYLLGSEDVYAMAIDSSDRKWLGTKNSGLYLVSETGDEVLAHFTTDNSLLPSNTITSLFADPNSNAIYVGTLSGLAVHFTDSSPARPDYSDVYAYPNPVTPDFTGFVTITGLMEDSLLKIVDSSMHLVAQLHSEGGMAQWDLLTVGGSRVKSGVYYVLASTGASSSSAADVVAKILVIN